MELCRVDGRAASTTGAIDEVKDQGRRALKRLQDSPEEPGSDLGLETGQIESVSRTLLRQWVKSRQAGKPQTRLQRLWLQGPWFEDGIYTACSQFSSISLYVFWCNDSTA